MAFSRVMIGSSNAITTGSVVDGNGTSYAGFSPSNLALPQGGNSYAWRFGIPAGIPKPVGNCKLAFPAQPISVLSVHRSNMSSQAVVNIQLSLAGSQVYTVTNAPLHMSNGQGVVFIPDAVSAGINADSAQLQFYDGGATDPFGSIGLAYLGSVWKPAVNWSFSTTFDRSNQTDEFTSRSGQEFPAFRFSRRIATLNFDGLVDAEVSYLDSLVGLVGPAVNVLCVADPTGADPRLRMVFGRLAFAPFTFPAGNAQARGTTITFTERL